MKKDQNDLGKSNPPFPSDDKVSSQKKRDDKKERLSKALRENLRKRKEQARLRQQKD
jgi:hypothetical protein